VLLLLTNVASVVRLGELEWLFILVVINHWRGAESLKVFKTK